MKKTTETVFTESEMQAKIAESVKIGSTEEVAPDDKIFVYLGPTVSGVIQKGSIYHGKNVDDIPDLALPLEKIPKIKRLLVEDVNIREVQQKLNSAENNAYTIAAKEIAEAGAALDAAKK